ncbi:MAG: phospholipase D-like domain-containing protein, partial [Pirellulaceae bacterium]
YIPEKNNLLLVQWACTAQLWQVLQRGCKVWLTPPPFDHSKIMLVDDAWSFVGSANWDPRSLRLNFEFNLECHDRELAGNLREFIDRKRARSKQITLAEVDGRPLPIRLRDGIARLATPYL